MPTVTGITPSARRQGRFELEVDERPVATLSLDAIERLGLHIGASFDDRTAAAVERESQAQHTMDRALNMLAFRARSIRELRRSLVTKGEPEALVDAAIERLMAMGVLDDREYARGYVHAKVTGPGFSRRRLRGELARRGVARDVADAAIEAVFAEDQVDEEGIIERVARKKARTLARLDDGTRRRRLYAFLARRGYELDDIRRVMERVLTAD
jgi:regulatory protein